MPRNVEGGRNELDMFGGGSGGLLTFYNYGPDGAPSNAPPTAFERGITRAPLESFGLMDVITNPEQIEDILNPPQFAIGPGFTDQNVSKEPPELDPTDFSRLEDTTGIFAEIFGGMGRSDLVNTGGELLQRIAELAAEGRPIAPADLELATLNTEDREAFIEAINQFNQTQETDESAFSISDVVEQATEAVTEGVSSAVQDAIDAAKDALPDDASAESILDWIAENVPEITPQSIFDEYIGAGVGVNLPTGAPIGSGTVFIPGIPGLPSSSPNMVIGTVDEVMQDILEGNLPGVIGDIAEDPVGGIGAVVEGVTDDAEEVTLGDLLGSGVDLGIGDDDKVSDIFTEEGQTTDYGAGLNDGETEDILATVGGAGATAAATGTGVQRPSGDFTPFMRRLQYTPVAIPKPIVPNAPVVSSLFSEYLK